MKHSIISAVMAALSGLVIHRGAVGGERVRNGLARVSKSAWLIANPRTSFEIAHVFVSPQMRPALRIEPRLMFKFLAEYLATDLSRKERAAMMIHHYRFLRDRAHPDFYQRIIAHRLALWQFASNGSDHRIWLSFPRTPHGEGDLTLTFEVDGHEIYMLAFTIGPGEIAGLDCADAIYIARVQGKRRGMDRIREATRECNDVSPAALLLAAAEGIAEAFGLEHMIGISAGIQVSTTYGRTDNFVKAYDEFWKTAGGSKLAREMYHLALPISGKPILSVKRNHRSRALHKRHFRKSVKESVSGAFRAAALRCSAWFGLISLSCVAIV
jgi:uncharacterized protein VirK/YbjX